MKLGLSQHGESYFSNALWQKVLWRLHFNTFRTVFSSKSSLSSRAQPCLAKVQRTRWLPHLQIRPFGESRNLTRRNANSGICWDKMGANLKSYQIPVGSGASSSFSADSKGPASVPKSFCWWKFFAKASTISCIEFGIFPGSVRSDSILAWMEFLMISPTIGWTWDDWPPAAPASSWPGTGRAGNAAQCVKRQIISNHTIRVSF